jgi:NTE family protein
MAAIRQSTRSITPILSRTFCSSRSTRWCGKERRIRWWNAALLSEFRAISFVKELIAGAKISHAEFRDIRMHRIDADAAFKDLSASSKINAEWAFLEYLRDLGRAAAEDWLEENFDAVGKKSTLDLSEELQRKPVRGAPTHMGSRVRQFLATRTRPGGAVGRR